MRHVLLILLLSGCATIDKQVEGWPTGMRIVEHEVGFWGVQVKCWEHLPIVYKFLGGMALACAEVNLSAMTCDIYRMNYSPDVVVAHEVAHCNGGDHDGVMQRYFDEWKGMGA